MYEITFLPQRQEDWYTSDVAGVVAVDISAPVSIRVEGVAKGSF